MLCARMGEVRLIWLCPRSLYALDGPETHRSPSVSVRTVMQELMIMACRLGCTSWIGRISSNNKRRDILAFPSELEIDENLPGDRGKYQHHGYKVSVYRHTHGGWGFYQV